MTDPNWRETQDGWTATLAEGVVANIQIGRKGVRFNFMVSRPCESIEQARAELMATASRLGLVELEPETGVNP